jgi:hypothetical protein
VSVARPLTWFAAEVVAPELFARAVEALRARDELLRLTLAVRKEVGYRPGPGFDRWLNCDATWDDLVARTEEAYERLVNSLVAERCKRKVLANRAPDPEAARSLVNSTLTHLVTSLEPSHAIAVVGGRIETQLSEVNDRLDEIATKVDERQAFEEQVLRLPPMVRRALAGSEHRDDTRALLAAMKGDDRRGAIDALVQANPPWLQTAGAPVVLAMAELCGAYDIGAAAAARYFAAAASSGVDPELLYCRAAAAFHVTGDTASASQLLEHAQQAGGDGATWRLFVAVLAGDTEGVLAAMTDNEALSNPTTTMHYGAALRTHDVGRAIDFFTAAVEAWPDHSGPKIELAWLLAGRPSQGVVVSRTTDRSRSIELALLARSQRRAWGIDAAEAVKVGCTAAMLNFDFSTVIRLGARPPHGEALLAESSEPEVVYAVFQAARATGRVDLARATLATVKSDFQRHLLSGELLAVDGADGNLAAAEFAEAWQLAVAEEDKAAVWFAAGEAGIDPIPGLEELDRRSDELPSLVHSLADMAHGRHAAAVQRLRAKPESESCARMLSQALTSDGRLDEAVFELTQAADQFDNPDHLCAAARLLAGAGRFPESKDVADRALVRLPFALGTQRAICHQVGLRAAGEAGQWRDMATRVRAWIDDQGPRPERRWLLVQALTNDGAYGDAWAVMQEAPALCPDSPLAAQLWITLSARRAPGRASFETALDLHDQFGAADPAVARALVNAVVVMADALDELDEPTKARYQAIVQRRMEAATDEDSDDTFFAITAPDSADEFIEAFRPHLEPQALRVEGVLEKVRQGGPYGLLAATVGRPYTSALVQRAAGCLPMVASPPVNKGPEEGAARAARDAPIVVDISALCTSWHLRDIWPTLRSALDRIDLAYGSLHDVRAAHDALTPRPTGYLTWDTRSDRPLLTEADPVELDRIEEQIRWVRDRAEECSVRDWPTLRLEPLADMSGDPRFSSWLGAIDLAAHLGAPLWCDDLGLRVLAAEFDVAAFSTASLLSVIRERGLLTEHQERRALRSLREEYYVDLEIDPEWVLLSGAAGRWKGGPSATVFTRPAIWQDVDQAYGLWRDVINEVAKLDVHLLAPWVYAAALGLCRKVTPDRWSAVVAPLALRPVVASNFDADVFRSCLAAAREACGDGLGGDLLHTTISLLFSTLAESLGPGPAAELVSSFCDHLDGEDRAVVREILFGL